MALFQEEEVTEEQFNKEHNLVKNDIFSKYGYDDILKERLETRKKRAEEENLWVGNIVSEDKINEWKNQGSLSPLEVWQKKNKNELVPYVGTWKQGSKYLKIKDISDKLRKGSNVTPEERKQFEDYVLDLAEIQTRGYSFLGQGVNLGLETLPFAAEFAIGALFTGVRLHLAQGVQNWLNWLQKRV